MAFRRFELAQPAANRVHRPTIGVVAVLLLAAGIALALWSSSSDAQLWTSAFLRIGTIMGLLWLAWPQIGRIPWWIMLVGLGVLFLALVLARQPPRVIVMAILAAIVVMRLRPTR
jgi:hypothetical protein